MSGNLFNDLRIYIYTFLIKEYPLTNTHIFAIISISPYIFKMLDLHHTYAHRHTDTVICTQEHPHIVISIPNLDYYISKKCSISVVEHFFFLDMIW